MRFMLFLYPSEKAEAGVPPDAGLVAERREYDEELAKAGVLIALGHLHPSTKGARIHFEGGRTRVEAGPFAEARGVVGGCWMIEVKSKEEAIEWGRRCPARDARFVELRQVSERGEVPEDARGEADPRPR